MFRKAGALFCLLALLAGQSELVAGLLAVAAASEGSHTVHLQELADGGCKLVLSHERRQPEHAGYTPAHSAQDPSHRHGLASHIICMIGGGTQKTADHVAAFTLSSISDPTKRGTHLVEAGASTSLLPVWLELPPLAHGNSSWENCFRRCSLSDTFCVQVVRATVFLV